LPTLFSKLTSPSSNHCDEPPLHCDNHCTIRDVFISHCDIDYCDYHSHCGTPISHCDTPVSHCDTSTSQCDNLTSHCDTSMASLPPEYCSHADSSPTSRFRELSPQRPCPRSISSATHLQSGYPLSAQILLPISQPAIPTHHLRPPPIPLSLHLVLTSRIPSAFFNGTQWPLLIPSCRTLFLSFLQSIRSGAFPRD